MICFILGVATYISIKWDQHCLMTGSVKPKPCYQLLTSGIWFYSSLWVVPTDLNAYRGNSLSMLTVLMPDLPVVPIWPQCGLLEQLISVLNGDFVVKASGLWTGESWPPHLALTKLVAYLTGLFFRKDTDLADNQQIPSLSAKRVRCPGWGALK